LLHTLERYILGKPIMYLKMYRSRLFTGLIRLQNVIELIIFSLDGQWLFVIYESSVIKSFVILWTILRWGNSWWIGIRLENH